VQDKKVNLQKVVKEFQDEDEIEKLRENNKYKY